MCCSKKIEREKFIKYLLATSLIMDAKPALPTTIPSWLPIPKEGVTVTQLLTSYVNSVARKKFHTNTSGYEV